MQPTGNPTPVRVSTNEFIRQLKMAPNWWAWQEQVTEELVMAVKDAKGFRLFKGPDPEKTTPSRMMSFVMSVKEVMELPAVKSQRRG